MRATYPGLLASEIGRPRFEFHQSRMLAAGTVGNHRQPGRRASPYPKLGRHRRCSVLARVRASTGHAGSIRASRRKTISTAARNGFRLRDHRRRDAGRTQPPSNASRCDRPLARALQRSSDPRLEADCTPTRIPDRRRRLAQGSPPRLTDVDAARYGPLRHVCAASLRVLRSREGAARKWRCFESRVTRARRGKRTVDRETAPMMWRSGTARFRRQSCPVPGS